MKKFKGYAVGIILLVLSICAIIAGTVIVKSQNISIVNISVPNKTEFVNQDFSINVGVKNDGLFNVKNVKVSLYEKEKVIATKIIPVLKKHAVFNVKFFYSSAVSGIHTLKVVTYLNGKIGSERTISLEVKKVPPVYSLQDSMIFKVKLGDMWYGTNFGDSSPRVFEDKIYVGGKNKYFFCLNKDTGAIIWRYEVKNAGLIPGIYSRPVFYKNNVYFGSTGSSMIKTAGYVFALNAENGKLVWMYKTDSDVYSVSISNNEIYAICENGIIYRLNALSGKLLKIYREPETNISMNDRVIERNGKIYAVVGEAKSVLLCLDKESGKTLWKFETDKIAVSPLLFVDNRIYFSGKYCLNAENGSVVWKNDELNISNAISEAIDNNLLFVASNNGNVFCLNVKNGKILWERTLTPIGVTPVISNGVVYLCSTDGNIYCMDEHNGKLLSEYALKFYIISPPLIYNQRIYVVSDHGFLYCLKLFKQDN